MEVTKVRGGCVMPGRLHRILIVTIDPKLIELWEKFPLAERSFLNGWKVKKWKGGFEIIGQYCPIGWRIKKGQLVLSSEKCLELWVPPEFPLIKKLVDNPQALYPRVCPECVYNVVFLRKL